MGQIRLKRLLKQRLLKNIVWREGGCNDGQRHDGCQGVRAGLQLRRGQSFTQHRCSIGQMRLRFRKQMCMLAPLLQFSTVQF